MDEAPTPGLRTSHEGTRLPALSSGWWLRFLTQWAPGDLGCSCVGLGGCEEPWSRCFSPQSASFGLVLLLSGQAAQPPPASHQVRAAAAPVPKALLPSFPNGRLDFPMAEVLCFC